MGSIIYDFLNESLLFDKTLQDANYASVSEERLEREIDNYRNFALNNINELEKEIDQQNNQLKVFGDRNYFITDSHLMQTALYLDQVVLPDPIFYFFRKRSKISSTVNRFLGMSRNEGIDRQKLSVVASRMKAQAPMIAANYLKYYPSSYSVEPDEQIPLNYSENGYSDVLPPQVFKKYRENAEVKSLRKTDKGWIVEDSLKIGRGIAIQFRRDNDENIQIYNLFEQKVLQVDEETKTVNLEFTLPDEPPPIDQFNAWVIQSVNLSARAHYEQLLKGLFLSSKFGASFLTGSEFTHNLLGSKGTEKDIESYTSDCVLNFDLPFLNNISMEDLMRIRESDGEAFELFRRELESKFRELRVENNPELIWIKTQNIVHELKDVQITKIDQKIKELKRGALSNTIIIAVGGLAGSVVTSGLSIAAIVIALANGYRLYSEFREKVRENPSYFLWKVKKAKQRP